MFSSYAPTPIKAHVYGDLFLFLASHPIFFFRPWLQICSYDWLCSPVPGDHKWITNRAYIPKLYFIFKYSITDLSKLSIIKLEGAGPGPPVCVWNIYLYYVKFEKVLYIYWQTWVHDFKGCEGYMSKHASKQVAIGCRTGYARTIFTHSKTFVFAAFTLSPLTHLLFQRH